MKSTKVQTLGTLYRNVEPIHECGITTIDGLDQNSMLYAPFQVEKNGQPYFCLRPKKYIRLKNCQPFISLLIFVLPVGCLVAKKIF